MKVRCGSHASSGLPVTERSPETTQLFEPVACIPRPSASRTRAICSATIVPLAGVDVARLHDDRIAARILGLEPGSLFGPGEPHDAGAQQLHLPVRGQAEAHQLGGGEQIDRVPRLGLEAQQLELDRQRAGRVDPGVDAASRMRSQGPPPGTTARAPRARRRGACRACASADPRPGRPPRRTRTAARRWCGGRTRAARDGPAHGRSRVRTSRRAACAPARAARRSGRAGRRRAPPARPGEACRTCAATAA